MCVQTLLWRGSQPRKISNCEILGKSRLCRPAAGLIKIMIFLKKSKKSDFLNLNQNFDVFRFEHIFG